MTAKNVQRHQGNSDGGIKKKTAWIDVRIEIGGVKGFEMEMKI